MLSVVERFLELPVVTRRMQRRATWNPSAGRNVAVARTVPARLCPTTPGRVPSSSNDTPKRR
jgi:hypothetical protein